MLAPSSGQAGVLRWHSTTIPPAQRWLVKNMLPAVGVALMSGQWSSAKTFMGLRLAYSVWSGEPFAQQKMKRCGGTLLLAAEAAGEIPIRLQAIALSYSHKQKEFPFAWTDKVPTLSQKEAINQLVAIA